MFMLEQVKTILVNKKSKFQKLSDLFRLNSISLYNIILNSHLDTDNFSEKVWRILHNLTEPSLCENCKINKTKFENFIKGYRQFCSKKCTNSSEFRKQKIKNTNILKYGHTCPLNNKVVKDKSITALKNHYNINISNPGQLSIAKYKLVKNFYNVLKTDIVRNGGCEILISEKDFVKAKIENKRREEYRFKCTKCNTEFETYVYNGHVPICPTCNPTNTFKAKAETEIIEFIKSICGPIEVLQTYKGVKKTELDVFVKPYNIAFEYNGIYWHSSIYHHKNFHLDKTNRCGKFGVSLYHIFEDDWIHKKNLIKNKIRCILNSWRFKIDASNCGIRQIDKDIAQKFLNKYHIDGYVKSKVNLGIYYKNRLISMISFKKSYKKNIWELSRFANLGEFNVVGAEEKLLSYFENKFKPIQMTSYVDRCLDDKKTYERLGFNLVEEKSPKHRYAIRGIRRRNLKYNPLQLKKFDPILSKSKNLQNNNIYKIYDCGSLVFSKVYSS